MDLKFCIVIICIVGFELCSCQRRITHGRISPQGKKYMVYLLNAKYSAVQPDAWICGGALISEQRILTAAACLTEVNYIYAIAGYKKYVSGKNIDEDECTRTKKQKVVEIIIPKEFATQIDVAKPNIWMEVDVGIAVVEKPYDFTDLSYRVVCSYEPGAILINFDAKFEEPNTVAVVYGWGGTKARKPGEEGDINSRYLREARTVITNTTFCANFVVEELKSIVNNSLICAFGSGYLTEEQKPGGTPCNWRRFSLNESDFEIECREDYEFLFRNKQAHLRASEEFDSDTKWFNSDKNYDGGGICENDHGGPLVSLIGKTEILIGVALTSIYSSKYECQGPFLYVGTARSGSLIQCLLAHSNETQALCEHLRNNIHLVKIDWPKEKNKTDESRQLQRIPKKKKESRDFGVALRPQKPMSTELFV